MPIPFHCQLSRFLSLAASVLMLGVPATLHAQEQAISAPVPAQPSASSPPTATTTIDWDGDSELRWIEGVPIFLWWAGEDQPRLQVCTDSEVPGAELRACPMEGAPDTVKSLHVSCEVLACDELPLRTRVRLFGKVIEGMFVAGKKEAPAESKEP